MRSEAAVGAPIERYQGRRRAAADLQQILKLLSVRGMLPPDALWRSQLTPAELPGLQAWKEAAARLATDADAPFPALEAVRL